MSGLKSSTDEMSTQARGAWSPELEGLLRRWKRQVGLRSRGHGALSKKYEKRHYIIGIPASILNASVATGALTTFFTSLSVSNCIENVWIQLALGLLSLFTTCLTAYQTFIGYQGKAERNKTACDEYEALYRYIDIILSVPPSMRGDPYKTLTHTRSKFDEIVKKYDHLPQKYDTSLSFGLDEPKPHTIDIDKLIEEEQMSLPRLKKVVAVSPVSLQSIDNASLYITETEDVENAVMKNVTSLDKALAFELTRLEPPNDEDRIKKSGPKIRETGRDDKGNIRSNETVGTRVPE